jgi:zinc/manganese transport system permease protein
VVDVSSLLMAAGSLNPQLTWNLVDDVRQALEFPFMVNAFRAGAVVAVMSGLIGWFVVLRRQTFAGHTVAVVGFPGAAGAVLLGVSAVYGMVAFAVVAALLIASVPGADGRGYSEESAVTGTVQSLALATGYVFVVLYGGFAGGASALLFGSFLGVTSGQVLTLLVVAAAALVVLVVLARPLLFASVDPAVAAARGVPVRALGTCFLVLLALAAAEVAQITGVLLVFAMLVVPAASAQLLSPNPAVSVPVTVALALGFTWASLLAAYYSPWPIGFFLTGFAFVGYLLAHVGARRGSSSRRTAVAVAA